MKKVFVSEIKNGMVLAKNIALANGHILINKGLALSEKDINRLKNKDIEYVFIETDSITQKADENIQNNVENDVKNDESIKNVENNGINSNINGNTEEKVVTKDNNLKINVKSDDIQSIDVYKRPQSKEETPEFKAFKKVYDFNIEVTKDKINRFLYGEKIKIDEFYKISDAVFSTLRTKGAIFSYMIYLKGLEEITYKHCINVSLICNVFASWYNMTEQEKKNLTIAGLLHDVGKILIPPEIINKKGKLTSDEYKEVKAHTLKGYNIILDSDLPQEIKNVALMHHEKTDGSGYPLGLVNFQIDTFSKIVAICDIYEAMTAERSYHPRNCPFDVIKDFEESRFGSLDTEILLVFLKNIAYNYLGSNVRLSNDKYGEVVFINNARYSRPIVKCGQEYIDLLKRPELKIKEIV